MVRVGKDEMEHIGHLFENWEETMIWSCLQGVMGEAWADSLPDARSAQIVTGGFCFLMGNWWGIFLLHFRPGVFLWHLGMRVGGN